MRQLVQNTIPLKTALVFNLLFSCLRRKDKKVP